MAKRIITLRGSTSCCTIRFVIKRKMNREEKLADVYLKSLGFRDVVFEPEGKKKLPDFRIDGNIAVEVRRLNQNYFTKNKVQGLEESRIPLFDLIQSSLRHFDAEYKGRSYWISVRFYRPIGKANTNKKSIIKVLANFLNKPTILPCNVKVTENISFHIMACQATEGKVFRFAGGTDRESGGWVLSEFKKNFNHCIKEKSVKIEGHHYKYSAWWLVLVDQIAYGFDEKEKEEIKSMISINSAWNKVIILDSLNGKNILEINSINLRES